MPRVVFQEKKINRKLNNETPEEEHLKNYHSCLHTYTSPMELFCFIQNDL